MAISLLLWFVAVNGFIILFVKNEVVLSFKRSVNAYIELYSSGVISNVPEYIKISKTPLKDKHFQLYSRVDNRYVYVNADRIKNELERFVLILFLWEFLLTILIVFIVYFTVKRLLYRQERTDEFLKFILLALSHKLGNFLSAQKVNLELAQMDTESKIRMSSMVEELERDFNVVSSAIRSMTFKKEKIETVNIFEVVEGIVKNAPENVEIKLNSRLKNSVLPINTVDFRIAVSELINNAVKYSNGAVDIELSNYKNGVKLYLKNHIQAVSKGSGIGQRIVEFLSRKNGWIYTRNIKADIFESVLIVFPSKKSLFN